MSDYAPLRKCWQDTVRGGVKQISSPDNSVLLIGRVLVESHSDLVTVYGLEKQTQLTPLSSRHRANSTLPGGESDGYNQ